jgi:hypothetical protein
VGSAPYQACFRLAIIASQHWSAIDGEAASRGVDYWQLGFDRWLNAIEWWVVQRVKDPEEFRAELDRPLPGQAVSAADLDRDADSFMAFAAAFGATPPQGGSDGG